MLVSSVVVVALAVIRARRGLLIVYFNSLM